jgi:hypothetical protein
MGKGSGSKQTVNRYYMSIHFGICAEMDEMTAIYFGEKLGWSGSVSTLSSFAISRDDLFGGDKKEGGVGGYVTFLPGKSDQVMPEVLAERRGLTSATHPAYRGLASAYFTGNAGIYEEDVPWWAISTFGRGTKTGFYWGATPYMQSVWITGKRAPKGLNAQYAMIGNQVTAIFNTNTYLVTIGDDSDTVTDAVTQTVGGYAVRLGRVVHTTNELSWAVTLNDMEVDLTYRLVRDDGDPDTDNVIEGWTAEYGGYQATFSGDSVSLGGLTVTWYAGIITLQFGGAGADANPAHIIYECLTNTEWGMGATDAIIDRAAFETVAETLYHEGFGMSLLWSREQTIEVFISEILDHIQASLYLDPETGKLTIYLFRDNYNVASLPTINPDNAVLDNFQRKLWGETINEVVVTWTNPVNEQDETITYQDLGNIVAQGEVVSDSRNYYGVRTAALASRLAMRDVRQSSAPLASAEALLDRTQWKLKPGSHVKLSWPEYDIETLVMRVTNIDYGKIGDPSITVTLLEDIFALDQADYSESGSTSWIDPAEDPTPMDLTRIITAPAFFTSRQLTNGLADLTYPDVYTAILSATSNTDAVAYDIIGIATQPNGDLVASDLGRRALVGYTTLNVALAEEGTSTIAAFGTVVGGIAPSTSVFMFIGDTIEKAQEIALITARDSTSGAWTISRGLLDTIPRAWAVGTPVWFVTSNTNFFDKTVHGDSEAVSYKLLTNTSTGRLALADAPVQGAVLSARPHLPYRPSNVKIYGVAFGPVDLSGTSGVTSISVTWSNRNRTLEDNTVVGWTEATVLPETGQTTTIRVWKTDGTTLMASHTGITGTSYSLPIADWGTEFECDVEVVAVRDSYESLMGVKRRVRVKPIGYGDLYGDYYGGAGSASSAPVDPPVDDTDPYDPGEIDFPDKYWFY